MLWSNWNSLAQCVRHLSLYIFRAKLVYSDFVCVCENEASRKKHIYVETRYTSSVSSARTSNNRLNGISYWMAATSQPIKKRASACVAIKTFRRQPNSIYSLVIEQLFSGYWGIILPFFFHFIMIRLFIYDYTFYLFVICCRLGLKLRIISMRNRVIDT